MNSQEAPATPGAFAGLDLLSSAVVLIDTRLRIRHCNPAAENLFAVSQRACLGQPLAGLLGSPPALVAALENALDNRWSHTGHDIVVARDKLASIHMDCTVTPVDTGEPGLLLELACTPPRIHGSGVPDAPSRPGDLSFRRRTRGGMRFNQRMAVGARCGSLFRQSFARTLLVRPVGDRHGLA